MNITLWKKFDNEETNYILAFISNKISLRLNGMCLHTTCHETYLQSISL